MRTFATEFSIKPQTTANFVAHLIQWLRGTAYSEVLESLDKEIEPDNFTAQTDNGESLKIRELANEDGVTAIGFRHEYLDQAGRVWRTEAVMLNDLNYKKHSIRLRTQCIAIEMGARIEVPRKPYLVKAILADGWGSSDGSLTVSDTPLWLEPSTAHLELATNIVSGDASADLPIIYVSTSNKNEWAVPTDMIERMAYRLGGVAHVVAEPDRKFSFDLRDATGARNTYGGSIGLYAPRYGPAGRFFLGWELPSVEALVERVEQAAVALRTRMPTRGWDWSDLQERSLRTRRKSDGQTLEFKELEALYLEEIENFKELVSEQKHTIDQQNGIISALEADASSEKNDKIDELRSRVGMLLYENEISDRLRLAAKLALEQKDRTGLDDRTTAFLTKFVNTVSVSEQYKELMTQIKDCTSSNAGIERSLIPLLEGRGYKKKSEKKHVRLDPAPTLISVDSITLPKTPSDYRAAKNIRSQVCKSLGLNALEF